MTTTDIAGPLADLGIPSTALWREIFESMTVYAGVASRDGVVLGVNQAPLHAAGLQISMHAIGDAAIEQLLNAYELALNAFPRDDHRHRLQRHQARGRHRDVRAAGEATRLTPGALRRTGPACMSAR